VFICPGCKTRFRLAGERKSGKVKCPKCGTVSMIKGASADASAAHTPAPAAPQDTPPPEFAPGTEIAGHKIAEYVGGDAVTARYKAVQTSMGRTVLFNVLRSEHAANEAVRAKFFAEARASARLNHPNLLSVFDMGEGEGACFFTTEFVDGGTLPKFLARPDKASPRDRLLIATQIARALAYAQMAGVEEAWVEPQDIVLTEKLDVRIGHVGSSAPLRGGSPEPIMNVLVRLMHLVAAGKDLPPRLRTPGAAASVALPTAHDPLGGKLNALVGALMADEAAYPSVSKFAFDLEQVWEGANRRSAVSASTTAGGIVPIRLEKARRRQLPVKTILIVTAIATVLCGIVLWGVLDYINTARATKEAAAQWNRARTQLAKPETLRDALDTFHKLAKKYGKTEYGKIAKATGIDRAKTAIVLHEFGKAEEGSAKTLRDTAKAVAEIKAAEAALTSELGDYPLIKDQSKVRIKNIFTRYRTAAVAEWRAKVVVRIEGRCRYDKYGQALEDARAFVKKWPEAPKAVAAANSVIKQVEGLAETSYQEAKARAGRFAKTNMIPEAKEIYEKIVRTYGIPKYERLAKEEIKKLDGR